MAGGGGGAQSRSLEQTPTWAVAGVCLILLIISIVLEHAIELIGKQWVKKAHKKALYEALEKIKSELMLMGFISLLLTVVNGPISKICVSKSVGDSWHPCNKSQQRALNKDDGDEEHESYGPLASSQTITRRLLLIDSDSNSFSSFRRVLTGGGGDNCAAMNKVPLISSNAIHQLHIFIFVLAVFHVLHCILTLALGRAKMRRWKSWEKETRTAEYQFTNDPERFRFARDTSFGRRHLNFWSRSHILIWVVCFFRQFVRSVPKVDYLTLRHGFIMAHLAPQSATQFDFQKYIRRSLEDDFKVVVGISPTIWFCAVLFLLFNTHDWYAYFWLPFIPLIIVLLVGTKLQVIITRMGLQIQDHGDVVKGTPVVQPGDMLFWFNRPRLLLYLIHFVLFQNAFQLAFFVWSLDEFGLRSCFHVHLEDTIIRITMGVLVQILCSYVTLPLYALVTQILITLDDQMGSNMKSTVFDERVASALRKWHHTARKNLKERHKSGSAMPTSTSRPVTPTHGFSPIHLLQNYRISDAESLQTSPTSFFATSHYRRHARWEIEDSTTTTDEGGSSSYHHQREKQREMEDVEGGGVDVVVMREPAGDEEAQRGIEVGSSVSDFSFE
ncbi:MLO-like protein 6 [Acorus calamus]|uniref:MLO-like protein n=1 Tax=Acorus calamus TaxID=4465 RepID=A0AAV9CQX3_ACOCL|nr:MLO-like protein 6 [Acorus calamus]